MKTLITISDVRKYRQFGKQSNSENFNGHVREIQENQLTEFLSENLMFDFMNYLENGFVSYAGAFTRENDTQIRITGVDKTAWLDYSLRLNNNIFVTVEAAVLDVADTLLTVKGNLLTNVETETKYIPDPLSTLDFDNSRFYVDLLNGVNYQVNNNTIGYNGLRPYIIWNFLVSYLEDGGTKQGDVGNFQITGELFSNITSTQKREARGAYLQNQVRESNRITEFLNTNKNNYPLWTQEEEDNISSFDFWIT